jgi:class 3 adenylate cyclase
MPASGRTRSAERRQVTALFCDLVDSVSLTVRLDPEDMMHVVDVYLSACDDIIVRHGGTITQYMGDGVLAYFGYPRANEDDAANAVRAGLALRDAVGRLDLHAGLILQIRIGIATGLVVVDDVIGRGSGRHGIVGETPNLAARLQGLAPANGVVISAAT